jgi:hypothetical protein
MSHENRTAERKEAAIRRRKGFSPSGNMGNKIIERMRMVPPCSE